MTEQSPSPDTLSEIFARDPFTLTRDGPEIATMVAHLRAQRAQFVLSDAPGVRAKTSSTRKPRMSKEEAAKALEGLNLDLDL